MSFKKNVVLKSKIKTLADDVINGFEVSINEKNLFLETDLNELMLEADRIRKVFVGDFCEMCALINVKSGRCSEDCKFCAQSAHYKTCCETYDFLEEEKILKLAEIYEKNGVHCVCMVASGKKLDEPQFTKALNMFKILKQKFSFKLCASMGFLSSDQLQKLKDVGVSNCHCNIETSEKHFKNVCTSHTFNMKIEMLKLIKQKQFRLCSGVIIGMGESFDDRFDMATTLRTMKSDSIPINVLMPIEGTPFSTQKKLSENEILRTIAMFRFVNPTALIRLAGGRNNFTNFGELAFKAGASAIIVSNMLTQKVMRTIEDDKTMLSNLNRTF